MINHEQFMQRAIQLAEGGWPAVAPNPMVGCVIVKDNQIVSEGFHERFGAPHAEVNAINALPVDISPKDCTLYVTLEPCSHHGKTPPCADLLIEKGFKTVVIACNDPNPIVGGNGVRKLEAAGITVIASVLELEARNLNRRFFCYHENKRPYIILKWALSSDGFISRIPLPSKQEDNQITGEETRRLVHTLRAEVSGIMVGKNTVLADNPRLTTRAVPGKNPVRIVIDRNLEIPLDYEVFAENAGVAVFNAVKEAEQNNILFLKIDFDADILPQVFEKLYLLQVQSILVEGGAILLNSLIEKGYWDEAFVFQNPDLAIGSGLIGPKFNLDKNFESVGKDRLFHQFRAKI